MTINLELQNLSSTNFNGTFSDCQIDSKIINERTTTNNKLKLFLMKSKNMDEYHLKNKLDQLVSKFNSEIESLAHEAGVMPGEVAKFICNKFTNKQNANKDCVNIVDQVAGDQIIVSGHATFTKHSTDVPDSEITKLKSENSSLKLENSNLLKLNAEKDNTIKVLNDEVSLLKK